MGFGLGPLQSPSGPSLGLPTNLGSVSSLLGLGSSLNNLPSRKLPWGNMTPSQFFRNIDLDPQRWDELFPYRLMVIDSSDNTIVSGSSGKGALIVPQISVIQGTGKNIIDVQPVDQNWIFVLPISPQQLSIVDQYSIATTATLRGVLEEHNGIKFKMLNASGTLGVWPYRADITNPPGSPNILQSLFSNTINSFNNVAASFTRTINTITTGNPNSKPVSKRPENQGDTGLFYTGYYQALYLQQFLEQYAEAKKDPANASWRLVFDIPKQNQSFVVTPMQFQWQQSQNKPMEIQFSLQFKAWRRINLHEIPQGVPANNQPLTPGLFQRILNSLSQARQTMSQSTALIGSVRSDVETPLNILRQTTLFVKDLAGVVISAADLPSQIITDYKSSIAQSLSNLDINKIGGPTGTNDATLASISAFQKAYKSREGLTLSAVSNGQLGNSASSAQTIDPGNNIFNSPQTNFGVFDQVSVNSLQLNNAQQKKINTIIDDARQTSIATLKSYRQSILTLALQLSNAFGAGDSFYSKIFGLPAPIVRSTAMTVDEYEILASLYQVIQAYDDLTASTLIDDQQTQSSMDYVAGLASNAQITFNTSTSKILAPVPFGLTIEEIAARYLGDPQRWIEIATLNGLMDPYIDENGFQYTLLSNGSGREITVGLNVNLFIGQRVLLISSTQSASPRTILNIQTLSATSFLLTLDGDPNLSAFTTADRAYLQGYLPQTTNSQQKIYIPSDLPVTNVSNIVPPSSSAGDPYTALSKVDWLLTDDGDIALNNFADFRLSYGLTNIIQALNIKFKTILGTVLLHPNFGLGVAPGTINSELQIQDLYNSINNMIKQDPRFQSVTNLQISLDGPTLSITLAVAIAGVQGVFPINFQLSTTSSGTTS